MVDHGSGCTPCGRNGSYLRGRLMRMRAPSSRVGLLQDPLHHQIGHVAGGAYSPQMMRRTMTSFSARPDASTGGPCATTVPQPRLDKLPIKWDTMAAAASRREIQWKKVIRSPNTFIATNTEVVPMASKAYSV